MWRQNCYRVCLSRHRASLTLSVLRIGFCLRACIIVSVLFCGLDLYKYIASCTQMPQVGHYITHSQVIKV